LPDDVAIEIKYDEQLLEWFELNIESEIMCVDAENKNFDGSLQFSPSKHQCHLKVRLTLIETTTLLHVHPHKMRELKMTQSQIRATKSKSRDEDDVLSDSSYDSKNDPTTKEKKR
jgi:hypothetical protein